MKTSDRIMALEKLAFFGQAGVPGALQYTLAPPTVGQAIYDIGANKSISAFDKRQMTNGIVRTGINVNEPAGSLLHAGIGALAGNFISNMLGAGPFMRGAMTAVGANYGFRH